jgi:hypothetical protein
MAFQAGHIPSWHVTCERYALSPVAAGAVAAVAVTVTVNRIYSIG